MLLHSIAKGHLKKKREGRLVNSVILTERTERTERKRLRSSRWLTEDLALTVTVYSAAAQYTSARRVKASLSIFVF